MSVKRFNYALDSVWYANEAQYKVDYLKSIVFIHKSNGDGVAIYAHGSYFPTDVSLSNFNELVDNLLSEGNNITITPTTDAQGKITDLKIGAVSLSSLTGLKDADKTKLVEAQAVAGAFASVNSELIYDPTTANADSYTFQQEFTNLKGEKISPKTPTVKITAGDNIALDANANDGLVISATDTTYSISATANGTDKVNLNLSTNDTVPVVDKVTFAASGDASVSLSGSSDNEVITINATPYTGKQAISVDQSLVENATSKEIKLVIDPSDVVLTQSDAGLKTNLELWYKSSSEKYNDRYDKDANGITFKENHVYLLGKDKDTIPYIVSEFDATSFVKDSFLSDVQYLVITGEEVEGEPGYGAGVEPGKYIAFYFTTIERDDASNVDDVYSQQVIYLNVKDFYTPVSVSGDAASYSVVDKTTGEDGSDVYTVKNTLGAISRDNAKNTITVDKAGLATVGDIKTVIETIESDLDAAKAEGADANEIAVVTGIKQEKGKITAVDSGLAATKTYVDTKINALDASITATAADSKDENKISVATGYTLTQTDGLITGYGVTTTELYTNEYIDSKIGAATTTVVESTDTESQKYLDITSSTETNGSTKYTVKVSGIDSAISTAIGDLDSNVGTVGGNTAAAIGEGATNISTDQMFSKIVIEDGKLVPNKTVTSFVDRAKIEGYGKTGITTTAVVENYLGLTDSDSIVEAFAKANAAWDWGIIE